MPDILGFRLLASSQIIQRLIPNPNPGYLSQQFGLANIQMSDQELCNVWLYPDDLGNLEFEAGDMCFESFCDSMRDNQYTFSIHLFSVFEQTEPVLPMVRCFLKSSHDVTKHPLVSFALPAV